MDFDRTAITSLADLQREWSGLDVERAKVEDRLRSLDNNDRNSGWRGGGGPGRGGAGGRGNGPNAGRGAAGGSVGPGQQSQPSTTWSREKSRDGTQPHQISREKMRAMNRVWERGLDPETVAEEETDPDANSTYRPPQRGERGANASGTGAANRVPAGREVFVRNDIRGIEDKNRSRNGPVLGGIRGRGRRDSDPGAAGAVEPEAKRPRVTSAIVVPLAEGNGDGGGARFRDDGELDRWDGGQAMDEGAEVGAEAEEGGVRTRAEDEEAVGDQAENGQLKDQQQQQQQQQRFGGKIVVVSSTGRGRRPEREGMRTVRGEHGGPGRFRSGVSRVGGGRTEIRSSLASRLGPIVGRPVVVVGEDGAGENGNAGEAEPPEPKPMVEPSKPELQAAYKDRDTKKRNKRMFGGLVAHLGRARKRLEEDKGLIEKQQSMAEQAVNRQKEEKRKQRLMAIEAARKERDDELQKRDEIYAKQEKAFIALHSNAFITNQEGLKGSIFTKVLPRLAWRPNEHTDATQDTSFDEIHQEVAGSYWARKRAKALLAASDLEIDERIKQKREEDEKAFQGIDKEVRQKAAHREKRRSGLRGREDAALGRGGGFGNKEANSNGDGMGQHEEASWDTQGVAAAGEKGVDGDGDGDGEDEEQEVGKKRGREDEGEADTVGDEQDGGPAYVGAGYTSSRTKRLEKPMSRDDPEVDADTTERGNGHDNGPGDAVGRDVGEGASGERASVSSDPPTRVEEEPNGDGHREEEDRDGEGDGEDKGKGKGEVGVQGGGDGDGGDGDGGNGGDRDGGGGEDDGEEDKRTGENEGREELQVVASTAAEDEAGDVRAEMKGPEAEKAVGMGGTEQASVDESAPFGGADDEKGRKRHESKKRKASADEDDADPDASANNAGAGADPDADADGEDERVEGPSRSAVEGSKARKGDGDSDDGDEGADHARDKGRSKKKSRKSSRKHGKESKSRKSSSRRSGD